MNEYIKNATQQNNVVIIIKNLLVNKKNDHKYVLNGSVYHYLID